ncbi:hypothetical protein [Alkalicoccus chagannorensis]|uniref:hypothetical protein n=1 Tax=Alkalicoccus chagannorensis TaxID=427072 RepID=UPI000420CF6F|nr:hypothetical protein [Alkalicoccus chagannorensis]
MYYSREELERIRKEGEQQAEDLALDRRSGTGRFQVNGIEAACTHCGHTSFELAQGMMNTRGLTFFGLDWLNDQTNILVCLRCTHMHWFGGKAERIEEQE